MRWRREVQLQGGKKKNGLQEQERPSSRSTALEENVQKLLVEIKKKGGKRRRGRHSTTDEALGAELHHVPELHHESRMRQSWRRCF